MNPLPRHKSAFTLIEVMIAVAIIAIAMIPSIATIQAGRINARAMTLEMIGQNMAVAMMELVKRSGYSEIDYGESLPAILSTAATVNPLLELPRRAGSSSGAEVALLPAGLPGGVAEDDFLTFLQDWRDGDLDTDNTIITNDTNYLFYSDDQIAALSGYDDADSVPDDETVLDAEFAWGFYVSDDAAGAGGGAIGHPLKHIAIIVKWTEPRRDRTQYVIVETFVSEVSPRL